MKKDTLKTLLEEISHNAAFDELAALQKALDEGINQSDILYARCFGNEWKLGSELEIVNNLMDIRTQIIVAILSTFEKQATRSRGRKMPADHYARYFHALAILKVPKDDVEVDGKDHLLSAFYQLWLRDDGSKGAWRSIEAISWSISEEIKLFKRKRR